MGVLGDIVVDIAIAVWSSHNNSRTVVLGHGVVYFHRHSVEVVPFFHCKDADDSPCFHKKADADTDADLDADGRYCSNEEAYRY